MDSSLIAWIIRAIPFGTIIMYGAMGEIMTEKAGNLNLGVPGIMYLGGFAGFASAFFYENSVANPNKFLCILISLTCCILASMLGGLIFSFLTITSWQCLHVTLMVPDSSFKPVTILPQFGQCQENGTHS